MITGIADVWRIPERSQILEAFVVDLARTEIEFPQRGELRQVVEHLARDFRAPQVQPLQILPTAQVRGGDRGWKQAGSRRNEC